MNNKHDTCPDILNWQQLGADAGQQLVSSEVSAPDDIITLFRIHIYYHWITQFHVFGQIIHGS